MEKDDEVKGNGNSLDFGARIYDPRIGRWLAVDPLAGKYSSLSPYNFVGNSPIIFVDPDGRSIKPSDAKAQGQLDQAFNKYFGSLPEVQAHIKYRVIGKTTLQDGSVVPVRAYTFDREVDGLPSLSLSQAKKAIWNSELSKGDKLTAMAYLKALEQTNIIEVQHPSNDDEKIAPAVLSGSDELSGAKSAYNVALGIQNGTGQPIPESVNQATTGSVNGAPGFQSFPNENNVSVNSPTGAEIRVEGIYVISSGTNSSTDAQIQNVSNMILNATGGATYSESGPKKNTRTYHAIDANGTVLPSETRPTKN